MIIRSYCSGCNDTLVAFAKVLCILFAADLTLSGAYLFASYMEYDLLKTVMGYSYIVLVVYNFLSECDQSNKQTKNRLEFVGWIVLQAYIYRIDVNDGNFWLFSE